MELTVKMGTLKGPRGGAWGCSTACQAGGPQEGLRLTAHSMPLPPLNQPAHWPAQLCQQVQLFLAEHRSGGCAELG